MIETIEQQIRGAGGVIVNDTSADILMLVNNFSEEHQLEAPNQPMDRNTSDYSPFNTWVHNRIPGQVVGLADVR